MAETVNQTDGDDAPRSAAYWLGQIRAYEKAFEGWQSQCDNIDKVYTRRNLYKGADASEDRRYSIFWANIEVLKPAVYARAPVPVVAPRFKDNSPVSREASEMLERALVVTFEQSDIDGVMRATRDDFLLYGRGVAWVREATESAVAYDYLNRWDFAHDPAQKWREVRWVARRAWLTRDEGLRRFGGAFAHVALKKEQTRGVAEEQEATRAPVWEVWSKVDRMVYWVAEGVEEPLDAQPPPFDLRGFYPCPSPAYCATDGLTPIPDILHYKDQIAEIDEYTMRIASLSKSLRLRGFYAAGAPEIGDAIERAIKSNDDKAVLVPISSVAMLGGGSFKDSIVWLPVEEVGRVIREIVELRRVIIDDVYQITGISDIVRGASKAAETATAQQIKAQWGSARIRERQLELARLARDLTRITAEILAEAVDPQLLAQMSQSNLPTQQQLAQAQAMAQQAQAQQQPLPRDIERLLRQPPIEAVSQFLADDRTRGFTIEVETDSTIQPDEDAEKQRRTEFITAVGGLFQQAAPLVMQAPVLGPFAVEVIRFAASGFRAGRTLESALDELGEKVGAMAEQAEKPKAPVEDPKIALEKAKLEMQARSEQTRMQFEAQKHAQEMQFAQEKHQSEMVMKAQEIQSSRDAAAMDMQFKQEVSARDHDFKREESEKQFSDKRESREMAAKPAVMMQVDAGGAMEKIAVTLEGMAQNQAEAMQATTQNMGQAVMALTDAVSKLGGRALQ